MVIQISYITAERNKAENVIKMLCRLVPHTGARHIQNGLIHIDIVETDARKDKING